MWYNIISKGEKIMKITKKQMEILEENFNVDETEYSNGKYLSLEQWTNGGVDMFIELDMEEDLIKGLENYIENFDIDDEIDLYRESKDYREHFRITESVRDFEDWVEFINDIIKQLRECESNNDKRI